ncbi:transglycosylase SLT domain-containing protein [Hyphococcus luteus]|uniref:transglycosylase SLT domain-containing protein n=1 Tax=Hyphococcus luteus TaxID=2058213 RepID=UPI0013FD54C3|nr:transglycosylase SLT domain-containing protein [Marinicaulis flavus]
MHAAAAALAAALFSAGASAAPLTAPAPQIKPPAPGPAYMTRADKNRLLAVSKALKARQFSTAKSLTELVEDPIAQSLGEWMYLMAQDPNVDFNEADRFLDSHLQWPAVSRISSYVEKRIPNDAPAGEVLAFFDSRAPVTGDGKIQLARALFSVGDQEGGERYLRDAWINNNFTIAEERRILSVYGRRLTREDHAARVDRLLWGRQVTNARRVFPYLSSHERKKAEARAALLLQASSGQRLYDRLPEKDRLDSGMLHAAVRHNRRRGQEERAIALAALAPDNPEDLRNGARWWDERGILMRWALKNGRFADAYKLAAENGMDEGTDYAEAEFYAGWIALRFLKEPERAETHFLALASAVGSPISVSRAYYWLGRAAAAQGDAQGAKIYYANAAEHYYSYYGQLAAEEAGIDLTDATFSAPTEASPADRALFASRPAVAALRMLTDLNLDYEFMVFAYHVDDELERPGEYLELAKITEGEGAPHLTVRAGKVGIQRGAFAPEVAYPLVFVPDEAARFVSPEIVLGLSRQESEFNPRAYSRAGARGMMQLIPSTAQITARKEGLRYSRSALLDDPVYNMTIGAAHLSHLVDRFDGSLIMTLASYNAGANRVNRWIEEYGDPRSDAVDPLDWVELIPFSETRNYVQRVLENTQVYRGRLNNKPIPGRLAGDIERGGARGRIANKTAPSVVLASAAAPFSAAPIPPVPERTVERARRYAMENPPALPGANVETGPEGAAPIAYEEGKASAKDKKGRRKSGKRGAKPAKTDAPAPVLTPVAQNSDAQESAPAEALALNETQEPHAPAPAERTQADATQAAADEEPPAADIADKISQAEGGDADGVNAEQAALETAAPAEGFAAETEMSGSDEKFLDKAKAAGPADGVLNDEMEADAPPMAEAVEDATDDLSLTGMSESEYCRAYREFLTRNGLAEEAGAADLNAAALEELQGEDGACK